MKLLLKLLSFYSTFYLILYSPLLSSQFCQNAFIFNFPLADFSTNCHLYFFLVSTYIHHCIGYCILSLRIVLVTTFCPSAISLSPSPIIPPIASTTPVLRHCYNLPLLIIGSTFLTPHPSPRFVNQSHLLFHSLTPSPPPHLPHSPFAPTS